jgi:hypothetical protein
MGVIPLTSQKREALDGFKVHDRQLNGNVAPSEEGQQNGAAVVRALGLEYSVEA